MSIFILAISCLTTSNLPWFMDLTFQVPMQYCSLQYQTLLPSPVTSTTGRCFCFGSVSSLLLELFLHSFPVAYRHLPIWGVHLSVSYVFAFSYCLWGSQILNTEVVCHSLLPWTTFCQYSPPWPVRLGWPYTAWLIASLSWTRLWSMWSVWLVFWDCGFHSVCHLRDKDKRLMEASWWETLTERETGSCSDGQLVKTPLPGCESYWYLCLGRVSGLTRGSLTRQVVSGLLFVDRVEMPEEDVEVDGKGRKEGGGGLAEGVGEGCHIPWPALPTPTPPTPSPRPRPE